MLEGSQHPNGADSLPFSGGTSEDSEAQSIKGVAKGHTATKEQELTLDPGKAAPEVVVLCLRLSSTASWKVMACHT